MTTIRQILDRKGNAVSTVDPEDTVLQALERMAREDIGALVVVENEQPIGIFTERHYARDVILKGRSSPRTKVREVMLAEFPAARPEDTVETCMAVMTGGRVRHLPVMESGNLIGIVSIGDLVKAVIDHQEHTIEQLRSYVSGAI